jgi:hypothetical protein
VKKDFGENKFMNSKKFAITSLCFAICAGTLSLSPALAQDTYVYQEQRLQSQEIMPAEEAAPASEDSAEAPEEDEAASESTEVTSPVIITQPAATTESAPAAVEQSTTSTTTVETTAPVPGSPLPLSTDSSTTTTTETTVTAPGIVAPVVAPVVVAPVAVAPAAVAITLPTDRKYLLVDPLKGEIINGFEASLPADELAKLGSGLVIIERSTGKLVAGIDSGKLVDVSVMSPNQTMLSSVDQRRAELDRMINDALASATLDASAATALRTKLDAISSQRAAFLTSHNSISFAEAVTLAYVLNDLSDQIVTVAHLPAMAPLAGTRFVTANGRIAFMGDLDYRIFQLNRRIDNAYTLGRLSSRQVADLKQRLNEVSADQDRNLQKGSLDANKIQDLVMKLDDIGSRLGRSIASRE